MNKNKTKRRDKLIALTKDLKKERAVQRRFLAKEFENDRLSNIVYITNCIDTLYEIIRQENEKLYKTNKEVE